MAGRIPDTKVDRVARIKHTNYCIGKELQRKLSEDRGQRMKHQRNDVNIVKEDNK